MPSNSTGSVDVAIDIEIEEIVEGAMPSRQTDLAAGYDVFAAITEPWTLLPGKVLIVPCGFHIVMPPGFEAQIRPRSGLALTHGVIVVNSPGTIDADFRGQVCALMSCMSVPFKIEPMMRIAQMVIQRLPDVNLKRVTKLKPYAGKRKGGFGSTGR